MPRGFLPASPGTQEIPAEKQHNVGKGHRDLWSNKNDRLFRK